MIVFRQARTLSIYFEKGYPNMKLALRIAAFAIVVAGAVASFSAPKHLVANHTAVTAAMPNPSCAYCR